MKVIQQTIDHKTINIFNSVSEASKKLNFKRDVILNCCKGKQKTYKGFIFSYGIQ